MKCHYATIMLLIVFRGFGFYITDSINKYPRQEKDIKKQYTGLSGNIIIKHISLYKRHYHKTNISQYRNCFLRKNNNKGALKKEFFWENFRCYTIKGERKVTCKVTFLCFL